MVGRVSASQLMSGLKASGRQVAGLVTAGSATMFAGAAFAQGVLGQPTDKALGLQPSGSALRTQAAFFHDWVLLPIIVVISLFVLALLIYVALKFNAKANPTADRFTHNTPIEVIWTVAPVVILAFIAIFSFRLLYAYHDMPKPDVTVKATGNQWYWNYEYPDMGGYAFDSNPLNQVKAEAQGHGLYRLAVDNPMVVPVGKTVQVLATGADVLHAFFVPAFGIQTTTIPGRVNQVWFKAEKEGVYYGQCNELCGVNHSFMPIQIDVVSQAKYDAWVAAHAKKPPVTVAVAAPAPVAPAAAPAADAAAATPAATTPAAPISGAAAPAKS